MDPELTIDENGTKLWFLDGQLHREDGPAVIRRDGAELWLLNGKLHRIGGPAIFYNNGSESWYRHGQLHRVDGPAIIHQTSNIKEYWISNIQYNSLEELTVGVIIDQ